MKNIDFGQTIAILANLGVIAGIVFLGFELQQNNELLEAQARASLLDRRTGANELLATNGDLARIMEKSQLGEALTIAENIQLDSYNRRILASFEWQFDEFQRGRLSFEDIKTKALAASFESPASGMPKIWMEWREQASPEFVSFMEQNVIGH